MIYSRLFILCCLFLIALPFVPVQSGAETMAQPQERPACEWCGANEAPDNLSWDIRIAGKEEPGEPLIITGHVYKSDGKTPAKNVILYLYHTNAKGVYPKKEKETGNAVRHGYLRSWLRTGKDGRYRFTTIKPAPYPNLGEPAHIHVTVLEPGKKEYWLDSFVFKGDPLITDRIKKRMRNRGGSGIIQLRKNEKGVWYGQRNIILIDKI